MDGEAAVAPGSVAAIAGRNHVMQGHSPPGRQGRRLARRAIHPRHPPTPHNFGLRNILEVHHAENVIGEAIDMRGDRFVDAFGA